MTNFNWLLDGSIVGVYLLATMIAGLMVRKYVSRVDHFLVAGREMKDNLRSGYQFRNQVPVGNRSSDQFIPALQAGKVLHFSRKEIVKDSNSGSFRNQPADAPRHHVPRYVVYPKAPSSSGTW